MYLIEVGYCFEHGIPHSEFLKWPEADQDKVITYTAWKNSQCSSCGTHPAEWLDEEGELVEPLPYEVDTRRCMGCVMLAEAGEKIPKNDRSSVIPFFKRPRRKHVRRNRRSTSNGEQP